MNRLFIILVNYNSTAEIKGIVNDFKYQDCLQIDYTIIIVDNSGELLNEKYFTENNVILLGDGKNLGYCGGNNLAFNYIDSNNYSGDILVCNPDVSFELKQLKIMMDSIKHWGIYTLPAVNSKGELLYNRVKLSGFAQELCKNPPAGNIIDSDFCPGSFIYIRIDPDLNYKLAFDERFFMYWEEVDLALSIKKSGGYCCFINNAGNIIRRENSDNWLRNALYYFIRNSFLMRLKHKDCFSFLDCAWFVAKTMLVFSCKAIKESDLILFKAMYRGLADGLFHHFGKK